MKQGGYLLIEAAAIVFLIVILTLTLLDVFRTRRQRELADKVLRRARERVFGEQAATDKGASPSNINEMKILHDVVFPDDFTEQLARAIHSVFTAIESGRGNTPLTNPSISPWEKLPEALRQSNIAQAADIGDKMEAIGAIIVPESVGAPEFHFTNDEVERLAQQEHERWMRDRLSQGWTYGQPRDDERKIRPDLQPWDALSEADRDKDRNAIRILPVILHEAGYQILRLPPNP